MVYGCLIIIMCVTRFKILSFYVSIAVPAWLKGVIYIGLVVASISIFPLVVFFLQQSKVVFCTKMYQVLKLVYMVRHVQNPSSSLPKIILQRQ